MERGDRLRLVRPGVVRRNFTEGANLLQRIRPSTLDPGQNLAWGKKKKAEVNCLTRTGALGTVLLLCSYTSKLFSTEMCPKKDTPLDTQRRR